MDSVLRVLLAVGAALAASALAQPPTIEGVVVGVESGDTMTVSTPQGQIEVRLADIGAPQGPQFYAPAARGLLSAIVQDRPVAVTVTGRKGDEAVFGRVRRGELDVNLELVQRGAAWVCWDYAGDTAYLPYENQAQRARIGIWPRTLEIQVHVSCHDRPPAERPLFPRN